MTSGRLTIGNLEILSLPDATLRGSNISDFFPGEPKEAWDAYRDEVGEDGLIKTPVNLASFLISSNEHLALVDTGIGSEAVHPFPKGGVLLDEMRSAGVRPEDVNIVFATHLHFDHIGWHVTMRGDSPEPTFPNARYVFPKVDWDALLEPDEVTMGRHPGDYSAGAAKGFAASRPIAERLEQIGNMELVNGDHNITDEITTVDTPGHTPGHMSLLVSSAGERLFVLGDVAGIPAQLEVPERVFAPDVHPDLGRKTRMETVKWLEREGLMVASAHFPAPGFGRVLRGESKRYWHAL